MSADTNAPAQPKSLRLVLTMVVAGLISGVAIVGAYQSTLPRITANKAERLRKAVFEVVPGAKAMQRLVLQGETVAPSETGNPAIFAAYDSLGSFLGYAIPNEGPGFQDNIKIIYGYVPSTRKIVGMQVLESRETPGLGDKIYKDDHFVGEFSDLSVERQVKLVKGAGTGPNEVDAITGATISSKAVIGIINAGNETWIPKLPAPGQEPAPPGGAAGGGAGAAATEKRGG